MKLTLKEFQEDAVLNLLEEAKLATNEVKLGKPQTIVFSAPTGSGKTVAATAFMERVLQGDDNYDPDPEATFLWITDQPELNEQTRRKLLAGSDVFDSDSLVTVEAGSFNQRRFDAGRVFFLNTQKLGRNSSLTVKGDKRQFTIWETIANTANEKPGSFWLIVDEAHRGMSSNGNAEDPQTLIQRLIKGWDQEGVPPVPLLLGISATPERFNKLIADTPRTKRSVAVEPEDVRASGLLKESITLFHADEEQLSDITLLSAAAAKLKEFSGGWQAYAARESAPEVRPVLVVQVEDGTKAKLTKTPLDEALKAVEQGLGPLSPDEIGHCFQEGGTISADGRDIRHVAPSDIEDDPHLRVVFFKMALTTGWDCPRAEVMMSFRTAKDETLIAQLVGRMVRTPLARSVSGDELLETVCLYLPYYDRDALDEIVSKLSQDDPEIGLAGTKVKRGNKLVKLSRDTARALIFDDLPALPMFKAQRVSRKSALRRYMTLGRELAWDSLEEKAKVKADFETHCVGTLVKEHERVKGDKDFKRRFDEAGRISVRSVNVKAGTTEATDESFLQLPVLEANIEQAHKEAGRVLGGGLHAAYVNARFEAQGGPLSDLKRELWALIQDKAVMDELNKAAQQKFDASYAKHKKAINGLSEERKQVYRSLRQTSASPPEEDWTLPFSIEGAKEGDHFSKHVFVPDEGQFLAAGLNPLEKKVLNEEVEKKDVLGWLRNEPRKAWAFSLSYERGGEHRTMYPDFLVFRQSGNDVVCDVLEPHTQSLSDSVAKAVGLARFAQEYGDRFERIELIDELGGKLKRLALHDPKTAKRVLEVTNEGHLRQLFEDA